MLCQNQNDENVTYIILTKLFPPGKRKNAGFSSSRAWEILDKLPLTSWRDPCLTSAKSTLSPFSRFLNVGGKRLKRANSSWALSNPEIETVKLLEVFSADFKGVNVVFTCVQAVLDPSRGKDSDTKGVARSDDGANPIVRLP